MELPSAPEGFTWQEVMPDHAAFLLPEGWHYRTDSRAGTEAFFITKEEIVGSNGRFETGLTVNLIRDIPGRAGVSPSEYAVGFIATSLKKKEGTILLLDKQPEQHSLQGFIQRLEIEPKEGIKITVHRVLIANDTTGTLWLIFFEAPSGDWEEAWLKGRVMLGTLMIDNEI